MKLTKSIKFNGDTKITEVTWNKISCSSQKYENIYIYVSWNKTSFQNNFMKQSENLSLKHEIN